MTNPILDLSQFRTIFNRYFDAYIEKKMITSVPQHIQSIFSHIKKLSTDGKRLRPYMAYLGFRIYCNDEKQIFEKLICIELFHFYALIHDDIIDNASTRHGVATIGCAYPAPGHAPAFALLVGDYILSCAYFEATKSFPEQTQELGLREFATMAEEVIYGQMIDVSLSGTWNASEEILEQKNMLKTASYTFTHPLLLGIAMSGSQLNDEVRKWLTDVGALLGRAFQMQDDIGDIENDAREGQPTLLTNFLYQHGTPQQKILFKKMFGSKEITQKDKVGPVEIMTVSGAVAFAQDYVTARLQAVTLSLGQAPISVVAKTAFTGVIELVAAL